VGDLRFLVFTAGFNSQKWVSKNILSVKKQTYKNFLHIVVDDATTDRTGQLIRRFHHERMISYRNNKNIRWISNALQYINKHTMSEEDVIVVVDLDDWLANPHVLQKLYEIYTDHDCWMTCGGYAEFSGRRMKKVNMKSPKIRKIREMGFTHLKTFKSFLWRNINRNDLKGQDGKYARCTYDRAIMYPMAEMATLNKIYFVDELLYIYNQSNPLSVCNIEGRNQKKNKRWFRGKKTYPRLIREGVSL
jgi:glycosyltransferase involved in cell wall biosynthesis